MKDPSALRDLGERWRCARRAALKASIRSDGAPLPESEDGLLARALEQEPAPLLRRVFENSLRLGLGFTRHYGLELTLRDLQSALPQLGARCAVGVWTADDDEPALRLARRGCPFKDLGAAGCDYWGEAVNGLVLGLTGGIHHARHRSVGHGDDDCVDVVHVDPESALRFGTIPAEIAAELEAVSRLARTFSSDVTLTFHGLSERVVYYSQVGGHAGGISVASLVDRALKRRLPHLTFREAGPRAVFASDSTASIEGGSHP